MVKEGTFREDLFYRLNVVPIVMPPLRERRSDIAELASRFVARLGEANARPGITLAPEAIAALERATWPGNVRELQNFLERVVVFAEGDSVAREEIERELASRPGQNDATATSAPASPSSPPGVSDAITLEAQRRDAERAAVREALGKAKGNRTLAARVLGVSRRTLYNKLDELGITDA
jgi:DNA-binding NtrC family response regulator